MSNPWESAPKEHRANAPEPWESAPSEHQNEVMQVHGIPGDGPLPSAVPPAEFSPLKQALTKWQKAKELAKTTGQGILDTVKYAGDVVQRPSAALGHGLAQLTGDQAFEFQDNGVPLISGPKEVATDRAKLPEAAALATDVVANPLTYVIPGGGATKAARIMRGMVGANLLSTMDPNATPSGVALATAGGGLIPAAVDNVIAPAVGKVANAVNGKLPAAAQAIQDLGDRFGVRTFAPDLANSPGLAKAGTLIESVPGSGMVKDRLAQQADALNAAKNLVGKYTASGDTGTTIQQGLANRLAQGKANANAAYDVVGQLSAGKGDVPLNQTLASIQKAQSELASSALPDEGLVGLLDKMKTRLTDLNSGVDLTYTGVRGLRSDLGDMISDYYKGTNSATGSKGVGVLQGVKNALEDDLGAFTKQNGPQIARAAKDADTVYKTQVIPYKDKMIAGAIKTKEPDQIYSAFIQAGKGDRAQNFYNALDADGQAAVRSQMVQNAMNAATEGTQPFSPAKFAQSLEKVQDASGVFFKGQDKLELDGFSNLMRHIQRAGQVAENPPNGQRLLIGLLGGEAVHQVGSLVGHGPEAAASAAATGAATIGGAKLMNVMFKTPWGKSFLLAASDLQPGSRAMANLVDKYAPKLAGVTAGSTTAPTPESTPTENK